MFLNLLLSYLLYPILSILFHLRFLVGVLIVLIPSIWKLVTGEKKTLFTFVPFFKFLKQFLFGKHVFTGIASIVAPYMGSIFPYVTELYMKDSNTCICKGTMPDLLWLRNPYQSLHACALANLAETMTGISMISLLQYKKGIKGIPTKLEIEYYKKSRGTILCEATGTIPDEPILNDQNEEIIITEGLLFDATKTLVAKCFVTWKLTRKTM